jgi:fructose-bisphosphate aldolase, class I
VSDCGKNIRLSRLLGGSERRALVVAFDHALVLGPIPGTEDPLGKIRQFAQAKVDALLLNLGLIRQFANTKIVGTIPALIARLDWTTVWSAIGQNGTGALHSSLLARPEEALRHGADAVLTYLVVGTGDAEFEMKEITRNAEVARECERVGIPLIVESLARGKDVQNPGDPKWLNLHTRMAVELGADVVKTDYSGDISLDAIGGRKMSDTNPGAGWESSCIGQTVHSMWFVKLPLREQQVSSLAAMFSKPTT